MRHENLCSAGKNFPKEKVERRRQENETSIHKKRRYAIASSIFGKTGSRPGVSKAFQRQRHWLDEIEIGNFLRDVCATCRLAAR